MALGNVAAASVGSPVRVLPDGLCRSFSHRREIPALENRYRGGESQVSLRVSAGAARLSWSLSRRLSPAQMDTLQSFFATCKGSHLAFYFYDLANEKAAVYDATGAAVTGRYTVRFDGTWSHSVLINRCEVTIGLIQIA